MTVCSVLIIAALLWWDIFSWSFPLREFREDAHHLHLLENSSFIKPEEVMLNWLHQADLSVITNKALTKMCTTDCDVHIEGPDNT